MSLMEKILYLSDSMEPTRNYDGVEELRALAFQDLDEAMILGLRMSCETVKSRGQLVYGVTEQALSWFISLKEDKNL